MAAEQNCIKIGFKKKIIKLNCQFGGYFLWRVEESNKTGQWLHNKKSWEERNKMSRNPIGPIPTERNQSVERVGDNPFVRAVSTWIFYNWNPFRGECGNEAWRKYGSPENLRDDGEGAVIGRSHRRTGSPEYSFMTDGPGEDATLSSLQAAFIISIFF